MEAEKGNFHPQHPNFAAPGAEAYGALRIIAAHKFHCVGMRKVAERLRKLCR